MQAHRVDEPAIIRSYRSDDLLACRALWVELTEWHRTIYRSPDIGAPDPAHYFDEHLERVGPDYLWIAELDGQVVGLTGLIINEQEAELEPLVVSAPYRGSGIGQQLAQAVIAAARTRGMHQLSVRPVARNQLAIQFFHQMGFNILGRIELFMDFEPVDQQVWQPGECLAQRDFRV